MSRAALDSYSSWRGASSYGTHGDELDDKRWALLLAEDDVWTKPAALHGLLMNRGHLLKKDRFEWIVSKPHRDSDDVVLHVSGAMHELIAQHGHEMPDFQWEFVQSLAEWEEEEREQAVENYWEALHELLTDHEDQLSTSRLSWLYEKLLPYVREHYGDDEFDFVPQFSGGE